MINEIICIGTSFTEASGLNPKKKIENPAVSWYEKNKKIKINSLSEYSWPSILQKLSKVKVRNLGKCGSSIEYLIRNVEEIIESEDCSDKLFILEYSSWGRSELWSTKYKKWVYANWGHENGIDNKDGYSSMIVTDYNFGFQFERTELEIYNKFLNQYFNEHKYLIQRDRNFLNLLYKLKAKNINYQIFLLENIYLQELESNSLFNYKNLVDRDMWGYVQKKGWDLTTETKGKVEDGHPSITGHKKIGELFYKKLKKLYGI